MGFDTSMRKLSCKLPGFEHATQEIKKALRIACESHGLTLGRHWVAYDSHRPQVIQDEDGDDTTTGSLKIRERLVRKTHETYEPHYCKNIKEAGDGGCSFLAIMLRNIETQDVVDYVLEFLWPINRDCIILVESLLLTLKRCLPNFIHASGAQLGDEELRVLDVDNATGVITSFNIFLGKGVVEKQDCISSSTAPIHNFNNINININNNASLSTSKKQKRIILDHEQGSKPPVKRKLSDDHLLPKISITYDSYEEEDAATTQHESSTSSNNTTAKSPNNVDDDEMLVVAQLEDVMRLFHIPCTSKLADLKKQISQQFSLDSSDTNYNIVYYLGVHWCLLETDYDLKTCLEVFNRGENPFFQVRVRGTSVPHKARNIFGPPC